MNIEQEVESLNVCLHYVLNYLDEVGMLSNQILDCPLDEQPIQVEKILNYAYDSLNQLQVSMGHLDTLQSLIGTHLFFVNAIKLGFPSATASTLVNIPGDSYILRHGITTQSKLAGTTALEDPKTALRHLSRIWTTIALGDQGELSAWKTLLDSGIPLENITIKPKLTNQLGNSVEPDFYCEAEQLICDAKAWKAVHSFSMLQETIDKYAACFTAKGEVRLFFPKDLCQTHWTVLSRLSSSNPSVQVTIAPLPQTHQELDRYRALLSHR